MLFPAFSKLQNDIPQLRAIVAKSNKISSFLIAPIMFAIIASAHPIISILLTDKWIGAVPFLQMACLLYALYPLHIANISAISAIGRSDVTLKCEIQKKIVDLSFLALTVNFSIYWVALGQVLTSFVSLWINMRPNKKFLQYDVWQQIVDIIPTFIIAVVMCASMFLVDLFELSIVIGLTTKILIGLIVYLLLSYMFNRQTMISVLNIIFKKR